MSDETRKNGGVTGGQPEEKKELPRREDVFPKDHEVYNPQGGGAGTGSGPIQEVAAVGGGTSPSAEKDSGALALPQVGPEVATAEALGLSGDAVGGEGSAGAPERPEASSFRLLLTLGFAGAVAGALLVFVFLWSDPGKISISSPIARALIGKSEGDVALVEAPGGQREMEILEVRYE